MDVLRPIRLEIFARVLDLVFKQSTNLSSYRVNVALLSNSPLKQYSLSTIVKIVCVFVFGHPTAVLSRLNLIYYQLIITDSISLSEVCEENAILNRTRELA